jgi:tripartite ATP-independent transporter DctP family solute receptor
MRALRMKKVKWRALRMKKVKLLLILALIFTLVAAVGCSQQGGESQDSNSGQSDEKTYLLKVGYVQNEQDFLTQGLYQMAERVEERTDGKLKIEVYHSSQLGDTDDVVEQAKAGANVGALADAGRLSQYVSEIGILDAPYLFDTYEEGLKIVTSDLWKSWEEELAEKAELRVLSFNWYQGARHFLTNKPVSTPEDLKGLRIRTTGSPVWQATVEAMGAKPTALAWAEIYSGLQQKVIDGAEAQHPGTYGMKLYENISHITKTNHFQLVTVLLIGEQWFKSLPAEYQDILLEESYEAGLWSSNKVIESLDSLEEKMRTEGVTITEIDLTPFKQATDKVYDQFPGFRELQAEFNNILGR